jgi:hypothetical protein
MLFLGFSIGSWASIPAASPTDITAWHKYSNDQYSFKLRYPPDYAVVYPRGQLEPPPLFRIWFKEASMVKSPIAEREPPQLAIDVYENASQQTLDAWLASSGVLRNLTRPHQQTVDIGGVPGFRVTDMTMLAPNTFYYVARGPFIYRFTPLGMLSDQIFATVRFIG